MTDNDIIKALECLGGDAISCQSCAYDPLEYPRCKENCAKDALDLINRQKAEIERLKEDKYLLVKDRMVTIIPSTDIRILSTEEVERLEERLKESGILDRPVVIAENPEVEMVGERNDR